MEGRGENERAVVGARISRRRQPAQEGGRANEKRRGMGEGGPELRRESAYAEGVKPVLDYGALVSKEPFYVIDGAQARSCLTVSPSKKQ